MIPAGWKFNRLPELAELARGRFSVRPRNDPRYYGGDMPFLQTGDIAGAEYEVTSFRQTLNEQGVAVSKVFPKGTLLMTIAAVIGEVAFAGFDTACPDSIVGITPKADVSPVWLLFALKLQKSTLLHYAPANAQKNINIDILSGLEIPTPPRAIQLRLEEIFQSIHANASTLAKLIEAKQRRRKALSQRLLLREAHVVHWPAAPLGDYFARVRRKNAISCQRVLTASGRQGLVDQEKYFNKCVAGENLSNYTRLVRGEFAYNRSAMTGYPCGAVKRLSDFDEGVVSPLNICLGLDHSRGDSDFFCHYFESGILDRELSRIVQVGARSHGMLNISATDLLALDVRVPSLPRQREIAAILNDADREIALHRAELDALKRQKRGLMQQLLTGKVRVP